MKPDAPKREIFHRSTQSKEGRESAATQLLCYIFSAHRKPGARPVGTIHVICITFSCRCLIPHHSIRHPGPENAGNTPRPAGRRHRPTRSSDTANHPRNPTTITSTAASSTGIPDIAATGPDTAPPNAAARRSW